MNSQINSIDPAIFKAYDIRGTYPDQLNHDSAYKIGKGFVSYLNCKNVAVGRDMRLSSPGLFESLVKGITESGADVIDIGLCSTDALYFTVGKFAYEAGIMITASHNPKDYNGFKMCRQTAVPLSGQEGLEQIKEIILRGKFISSADKGKLLPRDVIPEYVRHVLSFVDTEKIKPFKIVMDAGNGMAGHMIPEVFRDLKCQIVPMFFELDGSFPNHPASPIEPDNIAPLRKRVVKEKADLGVAFDGDADRMFIVDENGKVLGGDIVTALVAKSLLKKEKGASILYNLICSRTVPETISKLGGRPVRTRVGHALIKPLMKKHNAVFGGEHSGHFYFRENYFADSAFIALLVCLELFSAEDKPVSELVAAIDPYFRSGEINNRVTDIPKKIEALEKAFSDGKIDYLDGITVEYPDWWFNVRPSNTEPLLRLNLEADSPQLLKSKSDAVLAVIKV
ncbi:MAG: phosphomannomutase/phosphoglucomutase [candidate division Zixibacteria bacterium]|nr:phosphomannomutase/phosphoglucomutase [candidate division Zixibacteria bacterium]